MPDRSFLGLLAVCAGVFLVGVALVAQDSLLDIVGGGILAALGLLGVSVYAYLLVVRPKAG